MSAAPLSSDADFTPVSLEEWRARVEEELRGAAFETLRRRSADGGFIEPVYAEAPAPATPLWGPREWLQAPRISCEDADAAHRELLSELADGMPALYLERCDGYDAAAWQRLLEGVQVDAVEWHFTPGLQPLRLLDALHDAAPQQRWRGCLGVDPLGALLAAGRGAEAAGLDWEEALQAALRCRQEAPELAGFGISAEYLDEQGAHEVQQLGWLLAATVATWREAEARGLAPEAAAVQTWWRLSLGSDTFGALCAQRAARLLFRRLLTACGIGSLANAEPVDGTDLATPELRLHASCSRRTLQSQDAETNLLRATTQLFAGLLGGADRLTASAWDEARGRPSAASRRAARNLLRVLAEEGALDAVADPAAGSGYLEARTSQLAADAWDWFRGVEERGGAAMVLADGSLLAEVAATAAARQARLDAGEDALVGVTVYPPPAADLAPGAGPPAADLPRTGEARR